MSDHYSILGLTRNATDIEIKAAFRKLAKIYHPDKGLDSPESKAIFEKILKAYNVLINPTARRRYDSIHFHTTTHTQQPKQKATQKTQKNWTFTEEDLKRRQYYQQHYKAKQQASKVTVETKPYSDYKYILFATPLAVALLMLIISMFTKTPEIKSASNRIDNSTELKPSQSKQLTNGDMPYKGYFGNIKTFDTKNTIRINNVSAYDAIVAVFDSNDNYLQHAYLQNTYYIEFSKLPNSGVYWKCILGKNWNGLKPILNTNVLGAFDSIAQIQNHKNDFIIFDKKNQENEIEFLDLIQTKTNRAKLISNETNFFERKNHD